MNASYRMAVAGVSALVLAGCMTTGGSTGLASKLPESSAAGARTPTLRPDCYTVFLHDDPKYVRPGPDTPQAAAAFLGRWGGGAWNGTVCHDLWVLDVDAAGGTVLMIDAHGPGLYADATAFRRTGEITEDGRLRVEKGRETVEYWIDDDGHLQGARFAGGQVIRIVMERRERP